MRSVGDKGRGRGGGSCSGGRGVWGGRGGMIDDEKITKHLQHLAKKARRIRSTSAHQMARAPADMLY